MIGSGAMERANRSLARGLLEWSKMYLELDRKAAQFQDPCRDTYNESILLQTLPEKTRKNLVRDGMELYRNLPLQNELGNRRQIMEVALRQAAIDLHKEDPTQPTGLEMWEMYRFRDFREKLLAHERQAKENPNLLHIDGLTFFQRRTIIDRAHALEKVSFERPRQNGALVYFPAERVVNSK